MVTAVDSVARTHANGCERTARCVLRYKVLEMCCAGRLFGVKRLLTNYLRIRWLHGSVIRTQRMVHRYAHFRSLTDDSPSRFVWPVGQRRQHPASGDSLRPDIPHCRLRETKGVHHISLLKHLFTMARCFAFGESGSSGRCTHSTPLTDRRSAVDSTSGV